MAKNNNQLKVQITSNYNFVPIVSTVLMEDSRQNVKYSKIDTEKNSGEIKITLKAETPIFVSNKDGEFFKGANNKETIPGSTIKGMIRSNMQILGYDKINNYIEDYKIYFRDMSGSSSGLYADVKKYYTNVLKVETEKVKSGNNKNGGTTISTPKNVKAGYISCENGTYKIYPCEYIRVSHKHKNLSSIEPTYLTSKNVWYNSENDFSFTENSAMKKGKMLFTGRTVGNKPNARYIFTELDYYTEPIEISKEDILSYEIDYKMRARVNKEGKAFWGLPVENEEPKPVFYIRDEGQTHFGMTRFLRIAYKYSISDCIPEKHRSNETTFVDNVLGCINKGEGQDESFASKVCFGDFTAKAPIITHQPFKAILGEPKPSFFSAYTKGGKHYSEEDVEIRGHKKYWLKDFKIPPQEDLKENVATTLKPLNKGSEFTGVIKYKNLSDEELGLLLWSLRLEKGCYQSIGMGKSLGMGRVLLNIDNINKTNNKYDFENFCNPFIDNKKDADIDTDIDNYIVKYKDFLKTALNRKGNKSIEETTPIKEFISITSTIIKNIDNIRDMGLREDKDIPYYMNRYIEQVKDENKENVSKDENGKYNFSPMVAKSYKLVMSYPLKDINEIIKLESAVDTEAKPKESESLEDSLSGLANMFSASAKFGNKKNKKK